MSMTRFLGASGAGIFCGMCIASLQGGNDAAQDWARQFASVEAGEIAWDAERFSLKLDHKEYENARGDVFIRFRWHDGWDIQFALPRGPTDVPHQRIDPFSERLVFANGQMTEISNQGRKSFRRQPSAFSLRSSRSVFLDGAPLLAGKWLHEVGFPQGLATVTQLEPGKLLVAVPSFQVQLTLVPSNGLGASPFVLGKVEDLAENGSVDSTFEYSNFGIPKNLPVAIGYRRHVTLAPTSLNEQEGVPKPPLERDDFVLDVKVLPRLSDMAFEVSTAGFTDITKPRQLPGQMPPTRPQEEPARRSDSRGASSGVGTDWLPGIGVGLIIAAVLVFVRSAMRRA